MASREKANRAAERLAGTTRGFYETVVDHTAALQERNVRFAQDMIDVLSREYRQQAEANRAVTREFVERLAKQRDAFRTVAEGALDSYIDLLYAPLSYYEEGFEAAKRVTA